MKMSLRKCSCVDNRFERIPRSFWMRLFPSRRLYQCEVCNQKIFAVQSDIDSLNWQMNTGKFLAATTKPKQS